VAKVPAYWGVYVLIRLTRNYAIYAIQGPLEQGFLPPTGEELLGSLLWGNNCIAPMTMQHDDDEKKVENSTAIPHYTHHPWFMWLFRLVGFIPWDHTKAPNLHLEFPFASGDVYEKFTLQEAIADRPNVRPPKDAAGDDRTQEDDGDVLLNVQDEEESVATENAKSSPSPTKGGTSTELFKLPSLTSSSDPASETPSTISNFKQALFMETQNDFEDDYDEDGINEIFGDPNDASNPKNPIKATTAAGVVPTGDPHAPLEVRKEQNLDWRPQNRKRTETLPQKLERISNKIHSITLHTFHDHAYAIKNPNARYFTEKKIIETQRRTDRMKRRNQRNVSKKLDELLEVGAFSGNGPIIDRVGLILEPMMSSIYSFVCLFRANFNLATWQDPYHTFWFYLFVLVLTIILFFIPWRPVLFVGGLIFVGPQNYLIRKLRDWKILPPRKPRTVKPAEEGPFETPAHVFYSHQRGDGLKPPKTPPAVDPDEVHQVVVPYGRMMYQRFYDWPPEQEYATVTPIQEEESMKNSLDVPSLRGAGTETDRPGPKKKLRERREERQRGQRVRKFLGRLRRKKDKGSGSDGNLSSDDGLESVDEAGYDLAGPGGGHSNDQYSVVSTQSSPPRQATETTSLLEPKS